jgi:hypothetical protein
MIANLERDFAPRKERERRRHWNTFLTQFTSHYCRRALTLANGHLRTTQWLDVQICHARLFVPRKFYGELLVTPPITNQRPPNRNLGSLAATLPNGCVIA